MTLHVLLAEGGVDPAGRGTRSFKWSTLLAASSLQAIDGVEMCGFETELLFYSENPPEAGQGVMAHGRMCFVPPVREIGVPTVKVMAQVVAAYVIPSVSVVTCGTLTVRDRYPMSSAIDNLYGGGSDDGIGDEKPLPYPNDVNAIVNAVGRVTAVVNPPHIVGTQSRHFSLRTSCYDPEAEKKSREFTLECICPNTKRWEIARNVIPSVGALVHVSGQLIGTFENGRVVLPAVELLELLRLPGSTATATGPAGAAPPGGTAATLSPTTNRVMKNLHARAGRKGRGGSSTTPIPISYPPTSATATAATTATAASAPQPQKARAAWPPPSSSSSSSSQKALDAQSNSIASSQLGGDAAVPMLISDDSSSTATMTNNPAEGGFSGGSDDVQPDHDGDSDTSFVSLSRFAR